MHEMTVMEALLKKVIKKADQLKAKKVSYVEIELGEMSSFVIESIEMYWQRLATGTIAEQAEIRIKKVKSQIECYACKASFEDEGLGMERCPKCGSLKLVVLGGDELKLTKMEIEK